MIIVENRELLVPNNERYIGTSYDNNSEVRVFRISRYAQNGVDVSNLAFRLDIKYSNNNSDSALLDKVVDDDYITLTWTITSSVLQVPGTVFISLRATDTDGTVKWSSFIAALYVETNINTPGTYTGSLTELEQLEASISSVLDSESSRATAEAARVSAETARVNAETARVSAETARVTAENARATAESGRVSTFNTNEAQRASTFTTNEAQRTSTFNADITGWEARVTSLETGYDAASLLAQSYARGGTGTRAGEDTDNAMYYKEQAQAIAIGSLVYDSERIHFGDTDSSVSGGETSSIVAEDENGVSKKYTFKDTTARSSASSAQSTANTAVSNAATAQSAAEAAQTTANTAVSNAATAQSTANTAVSNAATAQTSADNAMARASIQSNDNLLDNSWFQINQRGSSSYTLNSNYCFDRWKGGKSTVSKNSDGSINIVPNAENGDGIFQYFETEITEGKPYTVSIMFSNGSVYSKSSLGGQDCSLFFSDGKVIGYRPASKQLRIATTSGNIENIKAVKLELGSVSTLANDSAPDYSTELMKCQRYYQKFNTSYVNLVRNSNTHSWFLYYFNKMRVSPSVVFKLPSTNLWSQDGNTYYSTAYAVSSVQDHGLMLDITHGSAPTSSSLLMANYTLELSADL